MAVPQRTAFTNLSQLINANQNNRLGSTIQSGVQKDVSGLQQDVNQASQQFNTQANQAANQNQANQEFVSNTLNKYINPAPPANVNAPQGQTAPTTVQNSPMVSGTGPTQPGMVQALESPTSVTDIRTQTAQANQPASSTAKPAPSATTQASNLNALPGSFGYTSNATSGTQQTDMSAGPNAGEIAKFGQYLKGNYTGPNQLQGLSGLMAKGANLQDIGQNATRLGGLQNLLQQYIQRGQDRYTRGEQALDTALLGQTAKPELQNILQTTRNASLLPGQAEAKAENLAANTALGNQQFAQDIRNQIAAAETPMLQQVQQQIQDQVAKNAQMENVSKLINDYLNTAPEAALNLPTNQLVQKGFTDIPYAVDPHRVRTGVPIASRPMTESAQLTNVLDEATKSGMLSPEQVQQIGDIYKTRTGGNLKDILSKSFNTYQSPGDYTMQQGATAEQAARLGALSQLAGLGNQFSTYGGMNPGTAGFDFAKIAEQINALKTPAELDPWYGKSLPGWNTSLNPLTAIPNIPTSIPGITVGGNNQNKGQG